MDYNIEKYIHIYNIEKYTHTHTKDPKAGEEPEGGVPALPDPTQKIFLYSSF